MHRLIIYTHKMQEMMNFYAEFFAYDVFVAEGDRLVELRSKVGGATLLLHPAAKSQTMGQALVKLVFDIENVEVFRAELVGKGIKVGPVHKADGYQFANFKDPSNNSISISSRAFAHSAATHR